MSIVVAAPAAVQVLSSAVANLAEVVRDHTPRLAAALEQAAWSGSERLRLNISVADDLAAEAVDLDDTAGALRTFAYALIRVDADGAGVAGTRRGIGPGSLVVVTEQTFRAYADIGLLPTVDQLVVELRARLEALDDVEGLDDDERERRRLSLERTIDQLVTLGAGRPRGWAGVGDEEWATGLALVTISAVLRERLEADLPEALRADSSVPEWIRVATAHHVAEQGRPFTAAALSHDVVITPVRLDHLEQLDEFATMPIDDFLEARDVAAEEYPWFDWSTDGCSGPVPDSGEVHCLRHDFLYRNARMLRDQWGLDEGFALVIKDFADETLGRDVRDSTDGLLGWFWGHGVEIAVEQFGTVETPWTPPD